MENEWKPSGIITLITDFGSDGPYAAIMKGVMLSIHPEARLVDITHDVPAGSVIHAALLLRETLPFFPPGTVHLAVVDPGVGGARRAMAVEADGLFLVGPDNGIFWPIMEGATTVSAVHLTERRFFLPEISSTFHGRDIFAPVAAHLAMGADLRTMGPRLHHPVRMHIPDPREEGGALIGAVLRVDRFGNLITNIHEIRMKRFLEAGRPLIRIGGLELEGLDRCYSDREEGEALALIGSTGHVEISVNRGRACEKVVESVGGHVIEGMEVRIYRSV